MRIMPRSKKPAGTAANPRNGTKFELVSVREEAPAPPDGLQRETSLALWNAYWTDVVSGLVQESEKMIVDRWIKNIDRYEILMKVCEQTPFELGSTGQTVKHPAWTIALALETSIRTDEAQLGYGPKNRAALGIAVVQQQSSLAEHNARYNSKPDIEGVPDDPRLSNDGQ